MMVTHDEQAIIEYTHPEWQEGVRLQTFQRSYAQILAGDDPWLPLGNFMHQFFGAYKHLRAVLVAEQIVVPEKVSLEQFRWAVFCAASVEYLCKKYDIPCPPWTLNPLYSLDCPWFYGIGADLERVQEKLRQTTPEEFSRRNIFCGDRIYQNKYEHKRRQSDTPHALKEQRLLA